MQNIQQQQSAAFHAYISEQISHHPELNVPATIVAMKKIFNAGFMAAATLYEIEQALAQGIAESAKRENKP